MRFSHLDPPDREWYETYNELQPLPECKTETPHAQHVIGYTRNGRNISCLGVPGFQVVEDWEEIIPFEHPPERVIRGGWWVAAAMWALLLFLLCGTIILISYTVRGG